MNEIPDVDLSRTYLHLEPGPGVNRVEVDERFWSTIGEREDLQHGRLVCRFQMKEDWPHWEMHPEGDELLILLSGAADLLIDGPDGHRVVELRGPSSCLVPTGAWHTAVVREPGDLVAVTWGAGTEVNPRTVEPEEVLRFWFGELDGDGMAAPATVKRWWTRDPAFDAEIRVRFGIVQRRIARGEAADWLENPRGRLAAVIALDQLSRNMYRGSGEMFSADETALDIVRAAIDGDDEAHLATAERTFLYMPFMHSERLEDQERCVELFETLAESLEGQARETVKGNVGFAVRHRDIVARFGRFPHRNALLGRASTAEEEEFLKQPGSSF